VQARRRRRWSILAVVVFCAGWVGWHVPVLYDAAQGHPVVYAIEVISYLGLGVVFWLQLIGSRPRSPALPPLHRVMALTGTVTVGTVLAMVLVFGSRVVYPGYLAGSAGLMGLVADQQVGGGVLWVLMLPSYLLTGVLLLMQWLTEEDAQGQALTAGLDRLLEPGRPTWPSRAGWR
ncbi:MAG TPA: cytochrome c oxidase assembly protein, partial [Streptosporangiaceae bacterium]|nr:cytochrome c oxidase assembly protein [Streptosporangiaceae bacterium]